MSKKALYLLGILLTILIGMFFYWKYCCNADCCGDKDAEDNVVQTDVDDGATTKTKLATSNPFAFSDGDFSVNSNDNFNFDTSGFSFIRPVSDGVNGGIDELQLYLGANENKAVNITGLYTSGEQNTSAFPNLGMARANDVKNYFITKGIPSNRMNLFGKLDNELVPEGSLFKGPLAFAIVTASEDSASAEKAELDALRAKLQADPLILNFATGETSINLSAEQRQKIADIARYLDKADGGKAIVTGHTDSSGSREGNITIGQQRADFAKGYLVSNGIADAKIEATSMGPDKPIASNATEEGKAQNRRTVVTVN